MKSTAIIFLAAGCAFVLASIVVLIWLLLRKCKAKGKEKEKSTEPRRKTTIVAPPEFDIPLQIHSFPIQLSHSDYDQSTDENDKAKGTEYRRNIGGRKAVTLDAPYKTGSESDSRKSSLLPVRRLSVGSNRLCQSTPDIRMLGSSNNDTSKTDEHSAVSRLSEGHTERRRKISINVMEQLKTHGKRVSSFDMSGVESSNTIYGQSSPSTVLASQRLSSLRAEEFSSSMGKLSEDSMESDTSALSSDTEVYSNPSIDHRKRLGRRRGESRDKKLFRKSGKLVFSTAYNADQRLLVVQLVRAFDIGRRFSTNDVNPFVRVYLLPGKQQKQHTKVQKKTKDPYFNESITFEQISSDDFKKYRLKLKVYNSRGHLGKNDLLGEVDMALSSLDVTVKETFEVDLFASRPESSQSQILISLSHQAAFSKLQVTIMKAKNLPKTRLTGSPDPYVIVVLCRDNGSERQETKAKRNSRNPVYNENFEYDVTTNSSLPLSTFSLVVTVAHHSLVGKDEILGHVIFSLDSPQKSAMEHWRAVSQSPHRPAHAEWHYLVDPDDL